MQVSYKLESLCKELLKKQEAMSKTAFSLLFFTSKEIRFQSSQEDSSQNYSSHWTTKKCQCSAHRQVPSPGEKTGNKKKSRQQNTESLKSHIQHNSLLWNTQKSKMTNKGQWNNQVLKRKLPAYAKSHCSIIWMNQMNKEIKDGPWNLPPLVLLCASTLTDKQVIELKHFLFRCCNVF